MVADCPWQMVPTAVDAVGFGGGVQGILLQSITWVGVRLVTTGVKVVLVTGFVRSTLVGVLSVGE